MIKRLPRHTNSESKNRSYFLIYLSIIEDRISKHSYFHLMTLLNKPYIFLSNACASINCISLDSIKDWQKIEIFLGDLCLGTYCILSCHMPIHCISLYSIKGSVQCAVCSVQCAVCMQLKYLLHN